MPMLDGCPSCDRGWQYTDAARDPTVMPCPDCRPADHARWRGGFRRNGDRHGHSPVRGTAHPQLPELAPALQSELDWTHTRKDM